ncbi:UPF0149 family protein [uncultured Desulfuromonas sp.]|uniref:UPF0149 family protein n=1 Tax=uncultured Desulfuromonas sp. TaxID=181013 RepID=UPI00260D7253|nr:UPF0149 family protein [uncultured Desulfuromonas sp.]
MLTTVERDHLEKLLAHAVNPAEAFNIDQLEGYLFGVVITPDVTDPEEWFADIFGEALASFPSTKQANKTFGHLGAVYNRLNGLRLEGELKFPFDLDHPTPEMLDRLRDWAFGLDKALTLRSYIWVPDEVLDAADQDDDDEADDIMVSLMIVLGVAQPDQIPEIFDDMAEQSEGEILASLIKQLPVAVETLQAYGEELEQERQAGLAEGGGPKPVVRDEKIGRNDPCPCGSGKKYKKCCGLN